jgi:hypothetical protein
VLTVKLMEVLGHVLQQRTLTCHPGAVEPTPHCCAMYWLGCTVAQGCGGLECFVLDIAVLRRIFVEIVDTTQT